MIEMKRTTNAFNFVYEGTVEATEDIIIRMPRVSPNKRGVNDIAWQAKDGDVRVYVTLAEDPETTDMWEEVEDGEKINKCATALHVINFSGEDAKVTVRAILS